jgi:ribokinase
VSSTGPEPAAGNEPVGDVLVVGSVNHDHFVLVDSLPSPGETVAARSSSDSLGGKGANQAVAASLAGAQVTFAGAVGDDASGVFARATFERYGVDHHALRVAERATGAAYITVDAAGENTIIVLPGANSSVGPEVLNDAAGVAPAIVVTQGELPLPAIAAAARFASDRGARFLLNLAPVVDVPVDVFAQADPLIVNEHEAARILGGEAPSTPDEALAVARLLGERARSVILTLGAAGAVIHSADAGTVHIPAATPPGLVVDTTGAGDAFVGVVAARLAAGDSLVAAGELAAVAAAISVSRHGTIDSYASAEEMGMGGSTAE